MATGAPYMKVAIKKSQITAVLKKHNMNYRLKKIRFIKYSRNWESSERTKPETQIMGAVKWQATTPETHTIVTNVMSAAEWQTNQTKTNIKNWEKHPTIEVQHAADSHKTQRPTRPMQHLHKIKLPGGGGALGYLGGRIRSLSKLKNAPKALIFGQKGTLILIKR